MKILSIKKSRDFQNIKNKGKKFACPTLILTRIEVAQAYNFDPKKNLNSKIFSRIGYVITKTIGNAVARNLVKRRLKSAIIALNSHNFTDKAFDSKTKKDIILPNFDYVIIARKPIINKDFTEITRDLKFCFTKISKITESFKNTENNTK